MSQAEQLPWREAGGSCVLLRGSPRKPPNRIPLWGVIYFNHILNTHTHSPHPSPTKKWFIHFEFAPWRFPITPTHGGSILFCGRISVGITPWFVIYWFLGEGVGNADWGRAGGSFDPSKKSHRLSQVKRVSCPGRPSPAWPQPIPRGRSGPLLMANEHARWERVSLPSILGPYYHRGDRYPGLNVTHLFGRLDLLHILWLFSC